MRVFLIVAAAALLVPQTPHAQQQQMKGPLLTFDTEIGEIIELRH